MGAEKLRVNYIYLTDLETLLQIAIAAFPNSPQREHREALIKAIRNGEHIELRP